MRRLPFHSLRSVPSWLPFGVDDRAVEPAANPQFVWTGGCVRTGIRQPILARRAPAEVAAFGRSPGTGKVQLPHCFDDTTLNPRSTLDHRTQTATPRCRAAVPADHSVLPGEATPLESVICTAPHCVECSRERKCRVNDTPIHMYAPLGYPPSRWEICRGGDAGSLGGCAGG